MKELTDAFQITIQERDMLKEKVKRLRDSLDETLDMLEATFDIDGRPIEPHERELINRAKQSLSETGDAKPEKPKDWHRKGIED